MYLKSLSGHFGFHFIHSFKNIFIVITSSNFPVKQGCEGEHQFSKNNFALLGFKRLSFSNVIVGRGVQTSVLVLSLGKYIYLSHVGPHQAIWDSQVIAISFGYIFIMWVHLTL